MGHVDERDPDLLLDRLELDLHLLPQLEVQGAQRLVEKEDTGPVDEGARERDALALPAGELSGTSTAEVAEAHHLERLADTTLALGLLTRRTMSP